MVGYRGSLRLAEKTHHVCGLREIKAHLDMIRDLIDSYFSWLFLLTGIYSIKYLSHGYFMTLCVV